MRCVVNLFENFIDGKVVDGEGVVINLQIIVRLQVRETLEGCLNVERFLGNDVFNRVAVANVKSCEAAYHLRVFRSVTIKSMVQDMERGGSRMVVISAHRMCLLGIEERNLGFLAFNRNVSTRMQRRDIRHQIRKDN